MSFALEMKYWNSFPLDGNSLWTIDFAYSSCIRKVDGGIM